MGFGNPLPISMRNRHAIAQFIYIALNINRGDATHRIENRRIHSGQSTIATMSSSQTLDTNVNGRCVKVSGEDKLQNGKIYTDMVDVALCSMAEIRCKRRPSSISPCSFSMKKKKENKTETLNGVSRSLAYSDEQRRKNKVNLFE